MSDPASAHAVATDASEAERIARTVAPHLPSSLVPVFDARFTRSSALFDEFVYRLSHHVLAEAVQGLWPDTQITFGPSTDDGFYYDFAPGARGPFTEEDLPVIEAKMREIIAADKPLRREVWTRDQLISRWKQQGGAATPGVSYSGLGRVPAGEPGTAGPRRSGRERAGARVRPGPAPASSCGNAWTAAWWP